jgi:hypothetical protein
VAAFLQQFYKEVELLQKAVPVGQNDVMMYFGSDFAFKDASLWFDFVDKLVHYANRDGAMNVMYSTPERFLAAKRAGLSQGSQANSDTGRASSSSSSGGHASDENAEDSSILKSGSHMRSQGDNAKEQQELAPGSSSDSNTEVRWALKSDDFFPYRCDKGVLWTGARWAYQGMHAGV